MICAVAADKKTVVFGLNNSADVEATRRCLTSLGAEFRDISGGACEITPIVQGANFAENILCRRNDIKILDCGESGSTLRFLLPFAAALGFDAEFHMSGRLSERPTDELTDVMEKNGVKILKDGRVLRTFGRLKSGIFELSGKVSSQFTSGLLMALPLVGGRSVIKDGDTPESAGYVDITLGILQKFMKNAPYRSAEKGGYIVNGRDLKYHSPENITIEGDWSNAAFFVVAGVLSGDIILNGLDLGSKQPDREIIDIIRRMGGDITEEDYIGESGKNDELSAEIRGERGGKTNKFNEKNRFKRDEKPDETDAEIRGIRVRKSALKGVEIDAKNIPDIIPAISVAAGAAVGRTTIYNAGRLRVKECDRLAATAEMLTRLGVNARIDGDTLTIDGDGGFCREERRVSDKKIILDGYNDHRMVMSSAVAAFACGVPVEIRGVEAVIKSYPNFFEDLEKLTK
jgi:3-phosphoshikimate 1-carboxyvinyltransferase